MATHLPSPHRAVLRVAVEGAYRQDMVTWSALHACFSLGTAFTYVRTQTTSVIYTRIIRRGHKVNMDEQRQKCGKSDVESSHIHILRDIATYCYHNNDEK